MILKNYLSLVKFSHTIFALPFAIFGFFLAIKLNNIDFSFRSLLHVLFCMIFARNAAMGFNRWADWKYDLLNPRTSQRELPAGIIKPQYALWFVVINCVLFVFTTYFINMLCFFLSPIALFVILGYSYTKRFTSLSHFVLGLGLSLAPIGAYLSVTGYFSVLPVLYSFCVLFWVSGFDIIYAIQDANFDKKHSLKSLPSVYNIKKSLIISAVLHAISAIIIVIGGIIGQLGWFYWTGSFIFISLLFYQHLIITPNKLDKINLAFFTLNGISSVLFALFAILDLLIYF